ncbi:MAG: glycoside hydrolase family 9 protein [Lachnospiraceae bacterium]|nr:glycoside hydrolase family 9 protein [Lachnospiraceae bacterium]
MGIYLNQVGYLTSAKKVATTTTEGTYQVLDAETKRVVCMAKATSKGFDAAAGEDAFEVDFSALNKPGKYFLAGRGGQKSYTFEISDKPYANLHKDLMKALYFQRCGCELKAEHAGIYTHKACHTTPAMLVEDYMAGTANPKTFDMTGGWHDAGDFGRYSTAAAVALGHILYAYELFPESFQDSLQIPESGNDMPDILNECLYELQWLIKMQREDGGVYHKLTAWRHAPFLMPEEDLDPFLLYPVSSMAVADYAAIMALASKVYAEYRPEFAAQALAGAKKAWAWLEVNEYIGFHNPEGSGTGEYDDDDDRDERFWAALEMAKVDHANKEKYLAVAGKLIKEVSGIDFGWTDVSALGSMAVLTAKDSFPVDLAEEVEKTVFAEADRLLEIQSKSGYGVAMLPEDYVWGSNMVICNRGMLFLLCALGSESVKAEVYKEAALGQLHYLLGRNAVDYSYVTGHGEHAFKNPHNRPTACDGIEDPMPGWVSGGPFKTPVDEIAVKMIPKGTAPMKCFIDHVDSYSTNEITIYWNSPAIFMTAYFMK